MTESVLKQKCSKRLKLVHIYVVYYETDITEKKAIAIAGHKYSN